MLICYCSGQFCAGEGPSQRHATNNRGFNSTSKIKQKKTSTTKPREAAQDTGKWLNPRASASMPKDAGKRRVSAVGGQGSGQWFTGQDGRKVLFASLSFTHFLQQGVGKPSRNSKDLISLADVYMHMSLLCIYFQLLILLLFLQPLSFDRLLQVYVSKNGQELTGRIAYRQYKMVKFQFISVKFQCSSIFSCPLLFDIRRVALCVSKFAFRQDCSKAYLFILLPFAMFL